MYTVCKQIKAKSTEPKGDPVARRRLLLGKYEPSASINGTRRNICLSSQPARPN